LSTLEAAPLSSREMRRKSVRLGTSHVAVIYPAALDRWFDDLVEPRVEEAAPAKWVDLVAIDDSGRFAVEASSGEGASGLGLGEALAVFWERVSFLLVDDLADAMALHAAAVRADGSFIVMPGASGCGKTRLSLWYRKQGYDLGSDEVVTVSLQADGGPELAGALPRPVLLKSISDASSFLRPGEEKIEQLVSDYGVLLSLARGSPWTPTAIERCLILFPRFAQNSPLILTPLSAGEAAFRLMAYCLNVRNLPRGGLGFARALVGRAQAIALDYGDTSQIEQTLDVLTRQWLAAPMREEDLASLCAAFAARDSVRSAVPAAARAEKRPAPAATVQRFPRRLTVGMATYDDYDGVYFTIQSLRNTNPELEGQREFVVIDNNPGGVCSDELAKLGNWIDGYRYVPRGEWSGTTMKNAVFEEASSPFVLCVDSHVLIAPGALAKLIAYFEADPSTADLLQGPMVYDDLRKTSTHFEPRWRGGMWGTWADDPRGDDPTGPAFDIPMQGMGLFACRRDAWVGFNPNFRGFGGEEGYIHEKTRQRGGRTLCLPFLRWIHRFNRPGGIPYVNLWEHRIRNYFIGFTELGLPTDEMEAHFTELLGAELAARIFRDIRREVNGE
jgi:Glycosyl transferase family 2